MEPLLADLFEGNEMEKGDRGRVGVVGGSIEHAGPPALTGQAALRTGADLVKIVTSEDILTAVAGFSENLVVKPYFGGYLTDHSVSRVKEVDAWSDVLVIGPGLLEPNPAAVTRIVNEASGPIIVDADAIEPVLESGPFPNAIFTPESNEVDQITDAYDSLEAFAEQTGAIVVSTGAVDEVYDGEKSWTNETGTARMTVGGTGDTLAGIIASLVGQGMERFEAAQLGTWLIGKAGERTNTKYGIGMTATDLIETIPEEILAHRDDPAESD